MVGYRSVFFLMGLWLIAGSRSAEAEKPPGRVLAPAPAPYVYSSPPRASRSLHPSFWIGVRPSFLAFGGAFFTNGSGNVEAATNFVKRGWELQAEGGVRVFEGHIIPYGFYEYGWLQAGPYFRARARASSQVMGGGLRAIVGDVDRGGILFDLSIGHRWAAIDKCRLSGWEWFRVGLGAKSLFFTYYKKKILES